MKYPRKSNTKKYLLALLAILLIAGGFFTYYMFENAEETAQQDDTSINFGPPTEEEQRAGDEQKDEIVEERENSEEENTNNDEGAKRNAEVIIVDADQYDDIIEVRAFVSNHVEDGTCSYQFTRNNQTVDKSLPAHADASTTVCPALEVPRSEFASSGQWQLVVSYESSSAEGESETRTVTIN